MIQQQISNFIPANVLSQIHSDLVNKNQWVWRTHFWRYYLIDNLQPYKESDRNTWYGNQRSALDASLQGPWKELFDSVFKLAGPNFVLQRYALNGQTLGQEQEFHADTTPGLAGNYVSYLMYLNTEWDRSWGGETEFYKDGVIEKIYPDPGKLVVFDSQTQHRGAGPTKPNTLRLSIVLHGQLV